MKAAGLSAKKLSYLKSLNKVLTVCPELCSPLLANVLLSTGCHKEFPQMEWLKTIEVYFLTLLGGQKSKVKVTLILDALIMGSST